jgi:hypothetical protein
MLIPFLIIFLFLEITVVLICKILGVSDLAMLSALYSVTLIFGGALIFGQKPNTKTHDHHTSDPSKFTLKDGRYQRNKPEN